jgi:8-oxo-dGTP pyrophosphatase MutT (NUDIX family)
MDSINTNILKFEQMYEVFLNDRKIVITDEDEPAYFNSGLRSVIIKDLNLLTSEINQFLLGEENILIIKGYIVWLWPAFQAFFRLIPAAGGIVSSAKGTLFIHRKHFWDLPKGKIDPHETPEEAALREVREETGLVTLTITGKLPSTWHMYQSPYEKSKGEWILKETKWFTMLADGDEVLIPETGEDIENAQWFSKTESLELISATYASLRRIIESIY